MEASIQKGGPQRLSLGKVGMRERWRVRFVGGGGVSILEDGWAGNDSGVSTTASGGESAQLPSKSAGESWDKSGAGSYPNSITTQTLGLKTWTSVFQSCNGCVCVCVCVYSSGPPNILGSAAVAVGHFSTRGWTATARKGGVGGGRSSQ